MSRKRYINTRPKADNCDDVTILLSSWSREKGKSGLSPKLNDSISRAFKEFELFNSKSTPNEFILATNEQSLFFEPAF